MGDVAAPRRCATAVLSGSSQGISVVSSESTIRAGRVSAAGDMLRQCRPHIAARLPGRQRGRCKVIGNHPKIGPGGPRRSRSCPVCWAPVSWLSGTTTDGLGLTGVAKDWPRSRRLWFVPPASAGSGGNRGLKAIRTSR